MTNEIQKENARNLLTNPVFKTIASKLESDYYQQWAQSETREKREELWAQVRALRVVIGTIKIMAQPAAEAEEVA